MANQMTTNQAAVMKAWMTGKRNDAMSHIPPEQQKEMGLQSDAEFQKTFIPQVQVIGGKTYVEGYKGDDKPAGGGGDSDTSGGGISTGLIYLIGLAAIGGALFYFMKK